jgi:phosphinothricin acetyltransferase
MIRNVTIKDASKICDIYNHYVVNTAVTFEEEPVTEKKMKSRIEQVSAKFTWLVYEEENNIAGYAYATEWRSRTAYRYSAETTVYIKPQAINKGIGTTLYKNLIQEMKALQVHCLIGGIALPNNGSIALHEKLNFKKVAHFTEVGFKLNKWVDVAYWQLLLNS